MEQKTGKALIIIFKERRSTNIKHTPIRLLASFFLLNPWFPEEEKLDEACDKVNKKIEKTTITSRNIPAFGPLGINLDNYIKSDDNPRTYNGIFFR